MSDASFLALHFLSGPFLILGGFMTVLSWIIGRLNADNSGKFERLSKLVGLILLICGVVGLPTLLTLVFSGGGNTSFVLSKLLDWVVGITLGIVLTFAIVVERDPHKTVKPPSGTAVKLCILSGRLLWSVGLVAILLGLWDYVRVSQMMS